MFSSSSLVKLCGRFSSSGFSGMSIIPKPTNQIFCFHSTSSTANAGATEGGTSGGNLTSQSKPGTFRTLLPHSGYAGFSRSRNLSSCITDKMKPYSPFTNTNSLGEYAVARLDDLLNWGRKVSYVRISKGIGIITLYGHDLHFN